MKKEYTNGEVTIVWQPDKCIHSAVCVKGLPGVFKPKESPWVKTDAATTEQLVNQIKQCPSGALSYKMNNEQITDAAMNTSTTSVEIIPDGPCIVKGDVEITHVDGRKEIKQTSTALCRCGASANKPFCDGSHRKIGFKG